MADIIDLSSKMPRETDLGPSIGNAKPVNDYIAWLGANTPHIPDDQIESVTLTVNLNDGTHQTIEASKIIKVRSDSLFYVMEMTNAVQPKVWIDGDKNHWFLPMSDKPKPA